MSERLTTAVEELRAEMVRIQSETNELRREIQSRETQLRQIQRALSVLDEKPRAKSRKKKPAVTRQDVDAAITHVLKTHGSLEKAELKRLVAEHIVGAGKSRMGFALRFTEALKDGRFVRDEGGLIAERVASSHI